MTSLAPLTFARAVIERLNRDCDVTFAIEVLDEQRSGRPGEGRSASDVQQSITVAVHPINATQPRMFAAYTHLDPSQRLYALAAFVDQIQTAVLEITHGTPTPACPGHRHPMVAEVHGDGVWWCCPVRSEPVEMVQV